MWHQVLLEGMLDLGIAVSLNIVRLPQPNLAGTTRKHPDPLAIMTYTDPYIYSSSSHAPTDSYANGVLLTEKNGCLPLGECGSAGVEPIAIIGMDLKFPGDASSAENFFEMLKQGRSALSDVPKDRYNLDAFYHPDQERPGTVNNIRL
ncbi:MAG: hypothetical protein Q9201_002502 [Fulgogasparrea decipioides]